MVLEKTLESPLDCKEIQPVHSKGDQSWVFIGRTDVEAETPILWSTDVNHRCRAVHFLISLNRLEKTLESPLDCMEIQPVYSKGDQSWVFIGRTDARAETPVLWPPHAKS